MAKREPNQVDLARTRRMLLDPHWTPPEDDAPPHEEDVSYLWASLKEQQERLDRERQHMDAWVNDLAESDAELLARRKKIIAGEDRLKADRRRFQAVMVVNWLAWAGGFAILGSFGRLLIARNGAPVDAVIALLAGFAALGWIAAVFAVPASAAVGCQWSGLDTGGHRSERTGGTQGPDSEPAGTGRSVPAVQGKARTGCVGST